MTDIYARQRQLIGSTAQWAANNLVLGDGEIAIEVVSSTEVRLKVGNGTDTFSACPYVSGSSGGSTVPPAVAAALLGYLQRSGGTMTGPLTLMSPLNPQPNHAISRAWAEQNVGRQFATAAEVQAGTVTDKVISPATFTGGAIDQSTGVPDARKLIRTGADGLLDDSFIDGVDVSSGVSDAGRIVLLSANGKLDPSMLGTIAGGMHFKGGTDVTTTAPPNAVAGDFWIAATTAVADPSWTGVAGQTISQNDSLIYDGTNWHALEAETGTDAYLLLDGSRPMLADAAIQFAVTADGNTIINVTGGTGLIDNVLLDGGTF